ncbi:MAG: ATP-binding cassette domain-containing protein, partial [Actinomycetota bacterium]|nr:ATP-binding cassette domain-containing protein [Actinomycetota bacterium]
APAIEVDGLEKRFGDVEAVRGVDFQVRAGETFGFLGPNGAGKSTTINMLCTLVRPTGGRAAVAGYDVVTRRDDVRREIGLVFQETTLDTYLTAAQNLRFHGQLYGVPGAQLDARMRQVLELVGLWERRDKDVSTFSGGMKRRLEIARGLLHSPRALFLDEPTVGLDPQTRASIWEYLDELRRQEDLTIFLTTHYMDEAEHCDRIAIMDAGRIVALDTPQALKGAIGTDRIRLEVDDPAAATAAITGRLGLDVTSEGGGLVLQVADGERFVPRLLANLGVGVRAVSVTRPSLDDVFMAYTGRTIRDADAAPGSDLAAMFRGRR